MTCSRYIELNPVRADMVKDPVEYPWSSYHYNALGQDNSLISPHGVYKALGTDDATCRSNYYALFANHITTTDIEIRAATNKAWVLGGDRFKAKVELLVNRQMQPKSRGGDRRSKSFNRKDNYNRV